MALKVLGTLLALFALSARPAVACTPIFSAAFGGLFVGYVVWIVLSLVLGFWYAFAWRELRSWVFWIPVGWLVFAVPMFAGILFVPMIMFIAFPMHLAVQFFLALFERPAPDDRTARLAYYGLPVALIIGLGISAKLVFYGQIGGLRALAWNYSHRAEVIAFALWMCVGLHVLYKGARQARLDRELSALQRSLPLDN